LAAFLSREAVGLSRNFPEPDSPGQPLFSRINAHLVHCRYVLIGTPGGASIPFGCHLPVARREGLSPVVFWVPISKLDEDLFFDVLSDLEENELFSSDFDVSEEFGLDDGFPGSEFWE
jgi:hypothetical protein